MMYMRYFSNSTNKHLLHLKAAWYNNIDCTECTHSCSDFFHIITVSSVFIGLIAVIQTINPTRERLIVEFTPQGLPGLQDAQQQANKSDTKTVAALFPPHGSLCVSTHGC